MLASHGFSAWFCDSHNTFNYNRNLFLIIVLFYFNCITLHFLFIYLLLLSFICYLLQDFRETTSLYNL